MKSKSNKEIDNAFNEINNTFEKLSRQNKKLQWGMIEPIHEKFPFAQNGITAMIAPPGSGKSYNYIKFVAKQEVLFDEPYFELINICSTSSDFDMTVKTFKDAIKKSKVVATKDVDLLPWINKYLKRILKYNAINDCVLSKLKNVDEILQKSIDKHKLMKKEKLLKYCATKLSQYQWKTIPHRCLLIMDDFASHPLLRSKETELCRMLKKLRHFYINVMICVQTVKSITLDLKRILTDVILFPGVSRDGFFDLIKEGPFGSFDAKLLWNSYKDLNDRRIMFIIYCIAGKVVIIMPDKNNNKKKIYK